MAKGDRLRMDPGDYLPTHPYDRGATTFVQRPDRFVPPHAIDLRVSQEGTRGRASLTVPDTPSTWRRLSRRFFMLPPVLGFADPHTARRRRFGYHGPVAPARIPHKLLPPEGDVGYTPPAWGPPRRAPRRGVRG